MRARYPLTTVPTEAAEFEDDIRRAFLDLGKTFGAESLAGECMPAVDVFESDDAVEIVVDLPGVDPNAIRVLAKHDTVLIVGEKRRAVPVSNLRSTSLSANMGGSCERSACCARATREAPASSWPTASCASHCRKSSSAAVTRCASPSTLPDRPRKNRRRPRGLADESLWPSCILVGHH